MLLQEVEAYGNLELLATQVVEGFITGLHKSPFHGFSVEFAEHRQYNPGESTKNIDWKLFARTDRVYVKRFEEETNLRCNILLDISGSMYYPEHLNSKLRFSALAAASICNLLKKQRDAFGISMFDSKIRFQSELKSNSAHYREILRKLQPFWDNSTNPEKGESEVTGALQYLAQTIQKRSLVVIFSDMFDVAMEGDPERNKAMWNALQQLRFQKNEVILFHIQHAPEELKLNFPSRPFRFEDIETGEKLILNPAEIKEEYSRKTEAFVTQMRTKCLQYKIDFYPIDVSLYFHQVLLPFYVKRMRMA
ncbi:MAG: DUF58 domain-containing protein [Bacteroidetes bacterium]|nr:DUF58 domain-containing protein [Bacteroidota bacterium]